MKRLLSALLALMLLITMAVPALATTNDTEPTETRTVEEILNEYYEKSFAAEMAEESGNPSVYSNRSGNSGKTLEEETVDELRAAGYEAYNVTSSNYEALEISLKTDFEKMGLTPDGSYIITISGEPSGNTRSVDPPSEDFIDDGGSVLQYEYNGNTYYMRYVTVTSAGTNMRQYTYSTLDGYDWVGDLVANLADTLLVAGVDASTAPIPFGTILSLLGGSLIESNFEYLEDNELIAIADTIWTCSCIQIWDGWEEIWETSQCSAYAKSKAYFTGMLYDPELHDSTVFHGNVATNTVYSPTYNNHTQRRANAVTYYLNASTAYDYTGDINFYLADDCYNIVYTSVDQPIFYHLEEWCVPAYSE